MALDLRNDAAELAEKLFAKTAGSKVVSVSDAEILHAQKHLKFSIFSIIHGGGLL
jgi:hypothetical protein